MSLAPARLAPLALGPLAGLLFASACASPSVPDAGPTDAARPAADAAAADAAASGPEAGVGPDASGDPDAAPTPEDAGPDPVDAAAGDAAAEDAMVVDPCGPVARADGPARFTEALGAWVARCNPELTPHEVRSISAFISFVGAPAFESAALTYDAASAGRCGCAIAAAPCESLAWLRAIPACDATFISTATTGDACSTDFDCPTRHRCAELQKDLALVDPLLCGGGVCQRFVGLGEVCSFDVPCAPGTYCDTDAAQPVCAANAAVGEDCGSRPCLGDADQVLILPPNQCTSTKSGSTCRARGRAGSTCMLAECHGLYRCDDRLDCQLVPGEGDPCPLAYSPTGGVIERELAIHEASYTCRGNIGVGIGAGTYCTRTSSTGAAVCRARPSAGQPCGLGVDLAPFCAPDAYCPGIDPQTFNPVTSTCVPRLTETATCVGRPFSTFTPNQECAPGLSCMFDAAAGEGRCADPCG